MFSAATKTDNVSSAANYIEDVFSTYLYTGNGTTQTITNGIDLAGKGGLVWIKSRSNATGHHLSDTATGITNFLSSDATFSQQSGGGVTSANSNGFGLTASGGGSRTNTNGNTYASWTFREQAKFFDIVTYTGDGTNPRTISHNLGSTPGFIIIKATSTTGDWSCYHRSLGVAGGYISLNSTAAASGTAFATPINSTVFSIENSSPSSMNTNGVTYVAYLFAHDAGGFGATGTDNVISCGSYTGDGTTDYSKTISLGYEPQWVMVKRTSTTGSWFMLDTMRGWNMSDLDMYLLANLANAETDTPLAQPNATGFAVGGTSNLNASGATYIYIAIRRGPMKTPTSGTSVFMPIARTGTGSATTVTGFNSPLDTVMVGNRPTSTDKFFVPSRLMGTFYVRTNLANVESSNIAVFPTDNIFDVQNGFKLPTTTSNVTNGSGLGYINYGFSRAPGFFDVVCYTETGVARAQPHNLGVIPELIIQKSRSVAADWTVSFNFTATTQNFAKLNLANAALINQTYASIGEMTAAPTATNVNLNAAYPTNTTLVMYLFATVAGVSKVGSYTGNGSSQTINCGFTAGARFILIKRTDSTGDWYVYDSARGITSGNDPFLALNNGAAEVTGTNYVDTASTGFQVTAAAPAGLNANGGTYIFLAIA